MILSFLLFVMGAVALNLLPPAVPAIATDSLGMCIAACFVGSIVLFGREYRKIITTSEKKPSGSTN